MTTTLGAPKRSIGGPPSTRTVPAISTWYGHFLRTLGRFERGACHTRAGASADPLSPEIHRGIAQVHFAARRLDEAIEQSLKVLDLDPNHATGYVVLAWAYEVNGLYDEAVAARLKMALALDAEPERIAALRAAYTGGGWLGFWRKVLMDGSRETRPPGFSWLSRVSRGCAAAEPRRARFLLGRRITSGSGSTKRRFDPCSRHTRNAAYLRQLGAGGRG
jgi:tetratricopeptide (TPR) repeat protein